jgi:prepilin-type N-terminal cleavage/methylation domain-containing protein
MRDMERARMWNDARRGLTLIELTITITLIAILTTVYLLVANPGAQLASSRNSERTLHLQTLMNAIRQNVADQSNQQFSCPAAGPLPTSTKRMTSAAGAGNYNIAPCLIPIYLFALPVDPSASSSHYNSVTDYDTGYTVSINASGTITLSAPYAELGKTVSILR